MRVFTTVVATTSCGGKAVTSSLVPRQGTPSRATSRLVVLTTDHGKARWVALVWGEFGLVEGTTFPKSTGTTTSCAALDGP
ncbi:hypothetical protein MTR67_038957 [Solanum verrucosum]|uniref:Uncharacterized protein n=1 Tax=Solanum verrucosum TaxID=315347 RepID=A0AAF0UHS3_SOLVR|nr:hypothetical protein MTR67_038954 [Solanum verrucosum]WMV45572.1 hypothetical protein MTR67_038957 [Solanum verrucosum]